MQLAPRVAEEPAMPISTGADDIGRWVVLSWPALALTLAVYEGDATWLVGDGWWVVQVGIA